MTFVSLNKHINTKLYKLLSPKNKYINYQKKIKFLKNGLQHLKRKLIFILNISS